MSGIYSRDGDGNRYLPGDDDPADFDWNALLTNSNLLILLQRNGKIRKACAWVSREALRPRFVLKKDKGVPGTKFDQPYHFESVIDYLEWIEFFNELEKVCTWSRLFGTSICVLYDSKEGKKKKYEPLPPDSYDSLSAYYPLAGGCGYEIVKEKDEIYYKIDFKDIMGNTDSFLVHNKRVVPFHAPQLELIYGGSSVVEPMAKLAIVQEQMFKSLMKRSHYMGAGIDIFKVTSEDEKTTIENSLGDYLKYSNRLWTSDDVDKVMKTVVPDLNSGQFREIWDIAQEEIATDMNITKKLISGDPQGDVSSAKWDTEVSYAEVYQTQRHYRKPIEHCLFLLGIKETTFEWNDPFPTEQVSADNRSPNSDRTNPTAELESAKQPSSPAKSAAATASRAANK
jgi:hypothetical protein